MQVLLRNIICLFISLFSFYSAYSQPEWLDPIKKMEDGVFEDVDTIRSFMQIGEEYRVVYEKTYYQEPVGMKSMKRLDHDKKTLFITEYSPDSSAYAERLRNGRMKIIYAFEWKKDEEGRLIHSSKSEKKGRRLLIFNTDNEYKFDKKERLVKKVSLYYLDNFDNYKRKTVTKFKYNKLDSVLSENQVTRRGLRTLHSGDKTYEYDPNGRLLKKTVKTNKLQEETFYEYDEKNRITKIRTDADKAYEEVFYEYLDGKVSKRFTYSFDGISLKYNSWSYSPNGKLLGTCENRDSVVYERMDNDSLTAITNYKLGKDDEVVAEILLVSQSFKNYRLHQRNSFEEKEDGKISHKLESFEYDDDGRLIKYTEEEMIKDEVLNYFVKTYTYDSRGYVSEYTINHPNTKMKRLFHYEITF
ncbi:hypothetical protein OAT71_02575 [Flavobacteriales bacterium]|nr:hypothetical protein [Flavobacteriales bacterium]